MTDIKKVIEGLKCCKASTNLDPFQWCDKCPYNEVSVSVQECREELSKDSLELIQEQQEILRFMFNRCEALTQGTVCGICGHREMCEKIRTLLPKVGDSNA